MRNNLLPYREGWIIVLSAFLVMVTLCALLDEEESPQDAFIDVKEALFTTELCFAELGIGVYGTEKNAQEMFRDVEGPDLI